MAAWLALAGTVAGQDGQDGQDGEGRSKFRARTDGPPAILIVPVQAKTAPGPTPGTTPAPVPPPGSPKPGTGAPGTPTVPGKGLGVIPGKDTPGIPGSVGGVPGAGGPGGLLDPNLRADRKIDEAYIRLDRPGREKLFGSRDTERELEERMRQEQRDGGGGDEVRFPEKPKLTDESYQARKFAPMVELSEPTAIVYRRLYFEEKNSERYGWDLGPIQPLLSTLAFFKDTVLFPHNFAANPCRRFDTNAGQCLPGDPVPYIVYPPELTGSGLLAEVGFVALLFAAVP